MIRYGRMAKIEFSHTSLLTSRADGKVLPGDLTHYVVPDVGVVVDYLEILEFRELQGIIFTQTACQAVQHSKGRRYVNRCTNLSFQSRFAPFSTGGEHHILIFLPEKTKETSASDTLKTTGRLLWSNFSP